MSVSQYYFFSEDVCAREARSSYKLYFIPFFIFIFLKLFIKPPFQKVVAEYALVL